MSQSTRGAKPALITLATCTVLFVLVAVFNTIPFRLSAPPYHLGSGALGGIFAVYLLGVVVTPASAPLAQRLGTARALTAAAGLSLLLGTPRRRPGPCGRCRDR